MPKYIQLKIAFLNWWNHLSQDGKSVIYKITALIIWLLLYFILLRDLIYFGISKIPAQLDQIYAGPKPLFTLGIVILSFAYGTWLIYTKNQKINLYLMGLSVVCIEMWTNSNLTLFPKDSTIQYVHIIPILTLTQVVSWFCSVKIWNYKSWANEIFKQYRTINSSPTKPTSPSHYLDYDEPTLTDSFGRDQLVENLVALIKGVRTPEQSIAISIQAKWGDGKSSFLLQTKENLKNDKWYYKDLIILEFNPWLHSSSDNLIHSFLTQLSEAMPISQSDLSLEVKKYANSFAIAEERFLETSFIKNSLSNNASLDETYQLLKHKIKNSRKRYLIIIDDLDRLYPREILEVLRLIRQIAAFPNLFYLVAYDKEYVKKAIAKETTGDENGFGAYTDKIFQHEITLPPISEKAVALIFHNALEKIISSLKEQGADVDYNSLDTIWRFNSVHLFFSNARDVKRFLNGFVYKATIKNLKTEVDFYHLFLVEILAFKNPSAYLELYKHRLSLIKAVIDKFSANELVVLENGITQPISTSSIVAYAIKKTNSTEGINKILEYLFDHHITNKPLNSFFDAHSNSCYFSMDLRDSAVPFIELNKLALQTSSRRHLENSIAQFMQKDFNLLINRLDLLLSEVKNNKNELAHQNIFNIVCYIFYRSLVATELPNKERDTSLIGKSGLDINLIQLFENLIGDGSAKFSFDDNYSYSLLLAQLDAYKAKNQNAISNILIEIEDYIGSKTKEDANYFEGIVFLLAINLPFLNTQDSLVKEYSTYLKKNSEQVLRTIYGIHYGKGENELEPFAIFCRLFDTPYLIRHFLENTQMLKDFKRSFGFPIIKFQSRFTGPDKLEYNDHISDNTIDLTSENFEISIHPHNYFWRFGFYVADDPKKLNFTIQSVREQKRVVENTVNYHFGQSGLNGSMIDFSNRKYFYAVQSNEFKTDNLLKSQIEKAEPTWHKIKITKVSGNKYEIRFNDEIAFHLPPDMKYLRLAAWADYNSYLIKYVVRTKNRDISLPDFIY